MATELDDIAVALPHSGTVERRGDYWVARSNEFGVTVYADTYDNARHRIDAAIVSIMHRLIDGGPDRFEARLKSKGIPYSVTLEAPRRSFTFSETVREELRQAGQGELQTAGA